VLLGKSKCGATVGRLVGGVAPLLILLKRWLYFSFFCPFKFSTVGRYRVTHNVLRVGDVALCCACGKAILLTRCYVLPQFSLFQQFNYILINFKKV
jgi:hypothetical protein